MVDVCPDAFTVQNSQKLYIGFSIQGQVSNFHWVCIVTKYNGFVFALEVSIFIHINTEFLKFVHLNTDFKCLYTLRYPGKIIFFITHS